MSGELDSWSIAALVIACVVLVLVLWCTYKAYTQPRLVGVPTDLTLYQGKWYEQMRIPSWFESPTLQNTTAEYKYDAANQTMEVINSGIDMRTGEKSVSVGTARPTGEPGRLGVKFFFWQPAAPYVVLSHDCGAPGTDYECAVVASDDKQYLWFLTRQPNWSEQQKQHAIDVARKNGYSESTIAQLQQVQHTL